LLWLVFGVVAVGGVVATLLVVRAEGLGTAATVVSLVLALGGAAAAVWRWLQRRSLPGVSTAEQLDRAMEALAETVHSQWRAEAAVRGLTTPAPARVRWVTTGRPVSDRAWVVHDGQSRLSLDGDGDAVAGLVPTGSVRQIRDLYQALPRGRLVILGEAGAGKTAAGVLLLLDALANRDRGRPVTILVALASWDPETEHLVDFVAGQLVRDHPYLRNPEYGSSAPGGLVRGGRVTPILDGFDEVAPHRRAAAIAALNRSGVDHLVLTSRTQEYQAAVTNSVLAGAAVVELLPVDVEAAIVFLSEGCSPCRLAQWEPVFASMRASPDGPVPMTLTSPLMLSLARQVYVEQGPAELLDTARFASASEVTQHLLDALVPALYPARPERAADLAAGQRRYHSADVRRWLGHLADHLDRRHVSELAWWRMPELVPRRWRATASMAVFAAGTLSLSWLLGAGAGVLVVGLSALPVIGLTIACRKPRNDPPASLGWTFSRAHLRRALTVGLRAGLGTSIAVIVALRIRDIVRPPEDPALAALPLLLLGGLAAGFVVTLIAAFGAAIRQAAPTTAPSPAQSFRAHGRYLLVGRLLPAGFTVGLCCVAFAAVDDGFTLADVLRPMAIYGLVVALVSLLVESAGQYVVSIGLLAMRGRTPWRLLRFLHHAHRRGVLHSMVRPTSSAMLACRKRWRSTADNPLRNSLANKGPRLARMPLSAGTAPRSCDQEHVRLIDPSARPGEEVDPEDAEADRHAEHRGRASVGDATIPLTDGVCRVPGVRHMGEGIVAADSVAGCAA
jgi:hypothetical protein